MVDIRHILSGENASRVGHRSSPETADENGETNPQRISEESQERILIIGVPSRELTYPTWGKGKSSSKCYFWGDMLISWRVYKPLLLG